MMDEYDPEKHKPIWGFYEEEYPVYSEIPNELSEPVHAKEVNHLVGKIKEARAQIAVLREALAQAAIDAAGAAYTEMPEPCRHKQPQTVWDLGHARGVQMATEAVKRLATDALSATPSDCYRQIRAEVREEIAGFFDRLARGQSEADSALRAAARTIRDWRE